MTHRYNEPPSQQAYGGCLLYLRLTGARLVMARLDAHHCLDEVMSLTEHNHDIVVGWLDFTDDSGAHSFYLPQTPYAYRK